MIPSDFITEWRKYAPWVQDSQVEQDLIINRALVEMYSDSVIANALAFRGGTALYKLHVDSPARYSEDIDLVQIKAEPIGPILDALRAKLDPWLGVPRRTFKEGRVILNYQMQSEGHPSVPMRLKIEINTREHFTVLGLVENLFSMKSRWYSGVVSIKTYQIDELLGTKLRALYQRKKGRDLFDLWTVKNYKKIDPEKIVQCFDEYLRQSSLSVSRAEFESNFVAKLTDLRFLQDIEPLIISKAGWDLKKAAQYVQQELLVRLHGEPWKG